MLQKSLLFLVLCLAMISATAFSPVSSFAQSIFLGQESYRGVSARAQLEPSMDSSGGIFLLSVTFSNDKTGEVIMEGDVAAKITSTSGRISAPVRLVQTHGVFQGEVPFNVSDPPLVRIGSKLSDGKKRIYRFPPEPENPELEPAITTVE